MKFCILKAKEPKARMVIWNGEYILMPSEDAEGKAESWGCDIAGCVELDDLLKACESKKPKPKPQTTEG
jgi:hypothetical protein